MLVNYTRAYYKCIKRNCPNGCCASLYAKLRSRTQLQNCNYLLKDTTAQRLQPNVMPPNCLTNRNREYGERRNLEVLRQVNEKVKLLKGMKMREIKMTENAVRYNSLISRQEREWPTAT